MADTATTKAKTKKIPVGSCKVYATTFTGTVPEDSAIETDSNELGYVSGGATVEYSVESTTFKDDKNRAQRTKITSKEAKCSGEMIAWTGKDMEVISPDVVVDTTSKAGHTIIKVGGENKKSNELLLVRLYHEDNVYGDVRVTMVGTPSSGFTLDFKEDEATKLPFEITASSQDKDGTLLLIDIEDAA